MNVDRENLYSILYQYFCIGDSYTYDLTRVKEAFSYGTVTIDDFEEWNRDNIKDLTNYIINRLTAAPSAPSSALPSSDYSGGKQGYIKRLIRADMEEEKNE